MWYTKILNWIIRKEPMIVEAALEKIRLKDARAQLGLSQAKLAELAGVHWHSVGRCERGETIRITSAWAILNALNERRALRNLPALELKDLTWKIEGEDE
jgi:DNA-binding XRE family transcriptional regulator